MVISDFYIIGVALFPSKANPPLIIDTGGPTFGFGGPALADTIVREIRLPRTLLALLVGGTLGLCGAALQGLLRNPLAEPGLLGASSGAAFGAVIVFYFGFAGASSLLLPLGAVGGSLLALAALYALAGRRGDFLTIVLAGIAINALAAALTSLALNFAPSPYAALEILFWMLGSLADRSLAHVYLAVPLMVPGWLLVVAAARGLDALTLGEDTALSLGFDPKRTQALVIGGTALAVGGLRRVLLTEALRGEGALVVDGDLVVVAEALGRDDADVIGGE